MLVGLPSKEIAKHWEVFRETLRRSIPTSDKVLPDRAQRWLIAALTGRLQCWLCFDPKDEKDEFYCAVVTRMSIDDMTGEKSLLVYAIGVFKKASREVREADWETLKKIANEWGCSYLSGYVYNELVYNNIAKLNKGNVTHVHYVLIPTAPGDAK